MANTKKPKDRFSEMNAILDECANAVAERAAEYRKAQERIGADKTPAKASPLSAAQAKAMASEDPTAR